MSVKKKDRLLIILLVICLALTATLYYASTQASAETVKTTTAPALVQATTSNEKAKDETVYLITDESGTVEQTIVSDWLKNGDQEDQLQDLSQLTDIKNVKGEETYKENNSGILWDAKGHDIFYQGTTDKESPIGVKYTYYLDGQEISLKALQGKSGKVEIKAQFTNSAKYEDVYVPFICVSAMILSNDNFSNVKVDNGKFINDGSKTILCGLGLPGLADSLDLDQEYAKYIPSGFTVTADANNFDMSTIMAVAAPLNTSDLDINLDLDSLEKDLDTLADSSKKLCEGSNKLYASIGMLNDNGSLLVDGVKNLPDQVKQMYDGSKDLADGITSLQEGVQKLDKGIGDIATNSASLRDGATQVFNTLLGSVEDQIKASFPSFDTKLTIENYQTVLKTLETDGDLEVVIRKVVADEIEKQASVGVYSGVKAAIKTAILENPDLEVLFAVKAYNVDLLTDSDVDVILTTAKKNHIPGLEDVDIRSRVQAVVDENLPKVLPGEIAKAKAQLEGALEQLNSFNTFYQGLNAYTQGVDYVKTQTDEKGDLQGGVESLRLGAFTLNGYLGQLYDGSKDLKSGITKFMGYMGELEDGSKALMEGMCKFDKEGIQKIVNLYKDDIKGLADKLGKVKDAGIAYNNFSGISKGVPGSVKFIFKTEM
ncbi:MAG: hypothetical protein MJ145_04400 [Clostridia bacterium]|nr:hypothetical protein [Clostridia bacterium]